VPAGRILLGRCGTGQTTCNPRRVFIVASKRMLNQNTSEISVERVVADPVFPNQSPQKVSLVQGKKQGKVMINVGLTEFLGPGPIHSSGISS
jgi:hypothetical protein